MYGIQIVLCNHTLQQAHLQAQLRVFLHGSSAKVAAPQHGPYAHLRKSGVAAEEVMVCSSYVVTCGRVHGVCLVRRSLQ